MSTEQLPPENFDPYEQAILDAGPVIGPQESRYHEWLGEDVNRKAAADFVGYLATRPYLDEATGDLLAPNGEKVIHNEYHDNKRNEHYEESAQGPNYKAMSMPDVARAIAQADLDNDKTRVQDLADILRGKVKYFASQQITERSPQGMSKDAQKQLYHRLMRVADNYKKSQPKVTPELRVTPDPQSSTPKVATEKVTPEEAVPTPPKSKPDEETTKTAQQTPPVAEQPTKSESQTPQTEAQSTNQATPDLGGKPRSISDERWLALTPEERESVLDYSKRLDKYFEQRGDGLIYTPTRIGGKNVFLAPKKKPLIPEAAKTTDTAATDSPKKKRMSFISSDRARQMVSKPQKVVQGWLQKRNKASNVTPPTTPKQDQS